MTRTPWNRKKKHQRLKTKNDISPCTQLPYKVKRVRPRKRKPKHQGFTVTPPHLQWIFENSKP